MSDERLYRIGMKSGKVLWIPEEGHALQVRLMVYAHVRETGHRGVEATLHRLRSCCVWFCMKKHLTEFVRQCLHSLDSKRQGEKRASIDRRNGA